VCNREFRRASLLPALLALVVPPVLAGPGELDVRFATHGWKDLPEMDSIVAAVPMPDGSVIVAGHKWPSGVGLINPHPVVQVQRIDSAGRTLWTKSPGEGYAGTAIRLQNGRILVASSSYSGDGAGRIVALLENGDLDIGFGTLGRTTLQSGQVVSGVGAFADAVAFLSMREMTDGNVLVAATVSNDNIPTAWDPATQAVVFRMASNGALLEQPRQGDLLFQQRHVALAQPVGEGRSLLLATNGCCTNLRGLLLSRDASGALDETPASRDSALSLGALAYDEANRRFYARGTWNSNSVLVAGDAAGAPDPSFGTDGTGRVSFPLATNESARLLVDEDGSVVTFRMLANMYSSDVALRATPRAQLFVGRRNASGLADPAIDGSAPVPLAEPEISATASNVQVAPGAAGLAWVTAEASHNETTYGPDVGAWFSGARLAKLQLGKGSGHGTVGFQVSSIRVAEQGPAQLVRVVRSGGSSGAVGVRYAVTSTPTGAGDLKTTSGSLTWPDGDATARTIEIEATDDVLLEGEERYTFTLLDPAGGVEIAGGPLVATIEDDDALALLTAEPRSARITAGQPAEFVLRLRRPVPGPVAVTALIGDSLDANDGWPRYTGRNNSGWVRQTVGWSAGDTGERVIRLGTNTNRDSTYSVDLHLRLSSSAGLVRQTADLGTSVVGSMVSVAGGTPPPGATITPGVTTSNPTVTTGIPAANASRNGGGSLDLWALISLFLLIFRRNFGTSPLSALDSGCASRESAPIRRPFRPGARNAPRCCRGRLCRGTAPAGHTG